MYLKSKEEKITDPDGGKNAGKVLINTTKEKILKIFRGNSKTKATGTETTK
jgi:hypothetical protein